MKLAQLMLKESVDEEAVREWMVKLGIKNYELHDDGTVTINSGSFSKVVLNSSTTLPFKAIRAINGSAYFACKNGTSSHLNKVVENASYGTITVELDEPAPLLSLAKIKGSSRVHVYVWGNDKKGEYKQLMDLGNKLAADLNRVRAGQLHIADLQEEWIDAGLGAYAKL